MGFVYRGCKSEEKDSLDQQELDVSKQLHASVRTANLETSLRLLSCGADPNFLHRVIPKLVVFTYFHKNNFEIDL